MIVSYLTFYLTKCFSQAIKLFCTEEAQTKYRIVYKFSDELSLQSYVKNYIISKNTQAEFLSRTLTRINKDKIELGLT